MIAVTDFALDNDYDLMFEGGDFLIEPSDIQSLALIDKTSIGHWKENPFIGIGISKFLGSNASPAYIKSISKQQYEADGFVVRNISMSGNLIISVDAIRNQF